VQLQEAEDPLARLGRQLRRLGRSDQRADHVELAPARDLHAAREVDRPQLDRRACERAHHRAGVAGVEQQPQPGEHVLDLGALEERRRAGQRVGHRALLQRDRHRLALVAHRAHEHADLLGRHAGARETFDLGRHALRLRALVCAAPEAHRAAGPGVGALVEPILDRGHDGLRGAEHRRGRAQRALQAHAVRARQLGGEVAQVLRRPGAPAVHRAVVVAGDGDAAVLGAEQQHEAQRGELEVLGVVDQDVAPARAGPRAHVGLVAQQRDRGEQQVAEVQRALLAQHAVMGGVDRRELALALGAVVARRQLGRPARDLLGGDHRVLEAIDPRDHRGQQRGRAALEVVPLQRELVDALEQHGEAVGGRDRDDERVEPGLERLVAQQPRAEAMDGVHRELLEPALELVLDAGAHRVGRGLRRGQGQHLLGRQPAGRGQPRVAVAKCPRLARPRRAHDDQRTAAVSDDLALARSEPIERIGHVPRIWTDRFRAGPFGSTTLRRCPIAR
jgi:hypothetical protein